MMSKVNKKHVEIVTDNDNLLPTDMLHELQPILSNASYIM